MPRRSTLDAMRVLQLMAEFGHSVSRAMAAVAPAPELVSNTPLVVLSQLSMHGSQRPHELAELTSMTTGGLSKLLDRMERRGVVRRVRGAVPGDRRAVVVELTPTGRDMMRVVTKELAVRLPEARGLLVEILRSIDEPMHR